MYFTGLRPGEARAIRWSDYDEAKKTPRVRVSIWPKFETTPKTEESCAEIPIAAPLAEILSEVKRSSEFILAGPSGKPEDLHNLSARVIVPTLERCVVCKGSESEHEKADHPFERD